MEHPGLQRSDLRRGDPRGRGRVLRHGRREAPQAGPADLSLVGQAQVSVHGRLSTPPGSGTPSADPAIRSRSSGPSGSDALSGAVTAADGDSVDSAARSRSKNATWGTAWI